jgi:hypothetical protein
MKTGKRAKPPPKAAVLALLLLTSFLLTVSLLPSANAQRRSSERFVEVRQVEGTVTYNGEPVALGTRLPVSSTGADLVTADGATAELVVDDGIGTIDVSESTQLSVSGLNILRSGGKTTELSLNKGKVKVKVRDFNNPDSRFEVKTPSGSAGVRGTEFGTLVQGDGETRLAVASGRVQLGAQNDSVLVEPGYSSIIRPGQGPTPPRLVFGNTQVSLEVLSGEDEGKIRVKASVNPVNSVFIEEQEVMLSETGELNEVVDQPEDGRLNVLLVSPLDTQQLYQLIVPQT